jgi:hypothetical protein
MEPVEKLGKVELVALIFWWPIENLIPSVTAYFYEYDPACFFGNDFFIPFIFRDWKNGIV